MTTHKRKFLFCLCFFVSVTALLTTAVVFSAEKASEGRKPLSLFQSQSQSLSQSGNFSLPKSFREIPGVTDGEIRAVEAALKAALPSGDSFTYGMLQSVEAFYRKDGSIGGSGANICAWLSELFGVPFTPRIFTWTQLENGLLNGSVDFSGDFVPMENQAGKYIMTDTISERIIKYARLKGSPSLEVIGRSRPPRYGFLRNSLVETLARPYLDEAGAPYASQAEDNRAEALQKLRSGELDVFLAESTMVDPSYVGPDIETGNFSPLLYKQVPLVTANPQLRPLLDVLDKYLRQSGGLRHLHQLHEEGRREYYRMVFTESLNETERAYYEDRLALKQPILYGISTNNYPIGFYNDEEKRWNGIAVDVLKEISEITELVFEPANAVDVDWPVVFGMLERDEIPMLAELPHTPDREGRFLWADKPNNTDHYALVSRRDFSNIDVNEILYSRIGLQENTEQTAKFQEWFPYHRNTVLYPALPEALQALEDGRIDLLMTSEARFLTITNYMERSDFKINLIFDEVFDSRFGFNLQETALRGVVSKALALIDTDGIASNWKYQVFDYRSKLTQTRNTFTAVLSVLLLIILALCVWLYFRHRQKQMLEQHERELRAARDAAEANARGKSDFLARMSHEMRTPMNAITGFCELMLAEIEHKQCRSECLDWLGKIHNASMTLMSIINDILDISKIDSGGFEILPAVYDLPSLINDTVNLNITRRGDKPVRFLLEIDESLPSKLLGDDLRIKQICNNLLSNAFKYTREGTVAWHLGCQRDGDDVWMTIRVRDSGAGIRNQDLDKLFSEYVQVDARNNRRVEGTGLGLALTKKLADMMGGSVSVESEYGKGSVFTAKILQKHVTDVPIGPEVAESLRGFRYNNNKLLTRASLKRVQLPYAKVLLVDDLRVNLEIARGMMKPYGMQIDCVTSGEEAIEAVRQEKVRYSAVFMDHMMPGMDGLEATQVIRREIGTEYAKNVPIIMLTANAIIGNEEMFLNHGFQAFLSKPIDIMRLDQVIRQWVRDKDIEEHMGEPGEELHIAANGGAEIPPESRLGRWRIEGLNLADALHRFGDDEALLRVLQVFAEDTPILLEQMRHVTAEGLEDYRVTVHGIKGSCRGISAMPLGDRAEQLEWAARAHQITYVEANNAAFIQEAETLLSDLRRMLGAEIVKEKKNAPDPAVLASLLEAARTFDVDGVYDAMSELERYKYDTDAELIPSLRESVKVMGFKQIAERLSKILEKAH